MAPLAPPVPTPMAEALFVYDVLDLECISRSHLQYINHVIPWEYELIS